MEPGGDDLQDDLVYESAASSYEGESSHLVRAISQDSDDQAVSSTADSESASLLAKKRKRRAKEKERKAKVSSCGEYILYTDRL
jgi:hypothetical protein